MTYAAQITVENAVEKGDGKLYRNVIIDFGPEPLGRLALILADDGTVVGTYKGTFQTAILSTEHVGDRSRKAEYQVWLRACLMEHEGNDQLVGIHESDAAAREWIAARDGEYFSPYDYYVMVAYK